MIERGCHFTRIDAEFERQIREDVLERTMWIDTGDDTTGKGRRALESPVR